MKWQEVETKSVKTQFMSHENSNRANEVDLSAR